MKNLKTRLQAISNLYHAKSDNNKDINAFYSYLEQRCLSRAEIGENCLFLKIAFGQFYVFQSGCDATTMSVEDIQKFARKKHLNFFYDDIRCRCCISW